MDLERVADFACELGEGPVWHPDEARLYWVDIDAGRLLRYDPASGDAECVYRTDVVTGVTVQEDGSLLLFMDEGRVGRWVDGELADSATVVESDTRFNDVIADPAGRVFCGTMPGEDRGGVLYRLDADGTADVVERDVAVPNGMGFTGDRERFYFTESDENVVYRYAYDDSTGAVTDRERFVTTEGTPGVPDGMTVDAEGCLWSARWKGSCVVRYGDDGRELARYDVPAEKVTSVTFGGPHLGQLYVTTAGGHERPEMGEYAGALYRFDPDVSGVEEFRSAVTL